MSDINSLIKSGAVPSATPRSSKIPVPELVITEDSQSPVNEDIQETPNTEDIQSLATEDSQSLVTEDIQESPVTEHIQMTQVTEEIIEIFSEEVEADTMTLKKEDEDISGLNLHILN